MRIAALTIQNFRGVVEGKIQFGKHSVLVGPNNVGKTTIIEALALVLGRDRLVRRLTEHDFFGSAPDETTRILIVATLVDCEDDDPSRHRSWFGAEKGVEKWFDGSTSAVHANRTKEQWQLAVQIGFAARFDLASLEAETVRFFVDDEDDVGDPFDEDSHIRPLRTSALQEVGFYLASATRTWDRWMSFSSELFRQVIATTGGLPAQAVRNERARVWSPQDRLEDAPGLSQLVANVNSELANIMAVAPKLELRLTTTDSEGVLQAIVPHFQRGSGPTLPAGRQGAGLSSLQSLLLLMQFGSARQEKDQCFILAVEEPELHVPPSQQKRLINRLNAVCNQTIVTTHSPVIASMFPPQDVLFVRNKSGNLAARSLAAAPAVEMTNHEQHLFFGWRDRFVTALMHDIVLIPEGVSDASWLDAVQTAIELRQGWDMADEPSTRFGTFVGVVPTADAKVVETFAIVRAAHDEVFCLVDGDDAGDRYLDGLKVASTAPGTVVRWPDGWAIEDVIIWFAKADASAALDAINTAISEPSTDYAALRVLLLKSKSYLPVQKAVAAALASNSLCRARMTNLLNEMADVGRGIQQDYALLAKRPDSSSATTVWDLRP
jgi:putative ATP-dependent endonuclease of OLD family